MSNPKAIIYVRNTVKKQLGNQVQHLLSYCDCENLDVVGIVRDKKASKNIKRWKLRKAERLARKKQAEFIVMADISRISRSTLNVIKYLEHIKEEKLKVKFSDCQVTFEQFNNSLSEHFKAFL